MNSEVVTLSDLVQNNSLSKRKLQLLESRKAVKALKKTLKKTGQSQAWNLLFQNLVEKINLITDFGLQDVLKRGWSTSKEIREIIQKSKSNPNKIFQVALAQHEISSEHRPRLQVLIGEKKIAEFEFEIELALVIETLILKIQNGGIAGVISGACKVSGSIEFENIQLYEIESKKINLQDLLKQAPVN